MQRRGEQPGAKKKTNILTSLLREIEEHNKETMKQGQNMDHL
jgi:23S rRNA maturation mini-RNase III